MYLLILSFKKNNHTDTKQIAIIMVDTIILIKKKIINFRITQPLRQMKMPLTMKLWLLKLAPSEYYTA